MNFCFDWVYAAWPKGTTGAWPWPGGIPAESFIVPP